MGFSAVALVHTWPLCANNTGVKMSIRSLGSLVTQLQSLQHLEKKCIRASGESLQDAEWRSQDRAMTSCYLPHFQTRPVWTFFITFGQQTETSGPLKAGRVYHDNYCAVVKQPVSVFHADKSKRPSNWHNSVWPRSGHICVYSPVGR